MAVRRYNKDFKCQWKLCEKAFCRRSDLRRHYRIHTNERPYRCTAKGCDKAFAQRSALTVHIRTHTGERPHVCGEDNCQRAFADSSSLARHRRIHTGERPYVCEEPACKRSFCRKTTLIKHVETSHASRLQTPPANGTHFHLSSMYHMPDPASVPEGVNPQTQQSNYLPLMTGDHPAYYMYLSQYMMLHPHPIHDPSYFTETQDFSNVLPADMA